MRKFLVCLVFISAAASFSLSAKKEKAFLPKSFKADFVQEYKATVGKKKIRKSFGSVDYQYPGKIRFEVEDPSPSLFVRNKDKSWYYTPPFMPGEAGQVSIAPAGRFPLSDFFDSLRRGLKSNKFYQVKKLKTGDFELIFDEKMAKRMGVSQATLSFKDKTPNSFSDLESISLVYPSKKKALIKLKNIKAGPSFSKNHFVFDVPKNTRVSR